MRWQRHVRAPRREQHRPLGLVRASIGSSVHPLRAQRDPVGGVIVAPVHHAARHISSGSEHLEVDLLRPCRVCSPPRRLGGNRLHFSVKSIINLS
jgi:hypothetical protein